MNYCRDVINCVNVTEVRPLIALTILMKTQATQTTDLVVNTEPILIEI